MESEYVLPRPACAAPPRPAPPAPLRRLPSDSATVATPRALAWRVQIEARQGRACGGQRIAGAARAGVAG